MFTFEFDAPKYKCFGGNQPRRSTITGIDSTSSNDRWFLNFNRPSCWHQMFKDKQAEKQQKKKELVEKKPQKSDEQIRKWLKGIQLQLENQQKQAQKDKKLKENQFQLPIITDIKIIQDNFQEEHNKFLKENQYLLKHQQITDDQQLVFVRQVDLLPKVKKQLVLNKNIPIIKKENQNKKSISSKSSKNLEGHKVSLISMDSKLQKDSKKSKKPATPDKKSKQSKSLANFQKNKIPQEKKRNRPCNFSIRIQKQWQQDHGRKWYELTSPQMNQAQKSMKKRLQQKTLAGSKIVKNKQEQQNKKKPSKKSKKNPTSLQKIIKFVKNPFNKKL